MSAFIFCIRCSGTAIDVIGWGQGEARRTATIRCSDCGNEDHIKGFTLGRVQFDLEDEKDRALLPALNDLLDMAKGDIALPRGGAA